MNIKLEDAAEWCKRASEAFHIIQVRAAREVSCGKRIREETSRRNDIFDTRQRWRSLGMEKRGTRAIARRKETLRWRARDGFVTGLTAVETYWWQRGGGALVG